MLYDKLNQISKESIFKEKGNFNILSEAIFNAKGSKARENFDCSNTVFKRILLDNFLHNGRDIGKVYIKMQEEFTYQDKLCIPERLFLWVNRDLNTYGNFVKGLTFLIEDFKTKSVQFFGDVDKIQKEIDEDNKLKAQREEEESYQFEYDFEVDTPKSKNAK